MTVINSVTDAVHGLWPRVLDPTTRERSKIVAIREASEGLVAQSDQQLRARADTLRYAGQEGKSPEADDVLVHSLSLVCEAARRTIGITYYDVQLLAGMALSRRSIAEMKTGEGKTFVAAFPAFFFALSGEGVHVMTVNAYLSDRDCELLSPLYQMLGMTVGNLKPGDSSESKRASYACDITYGPGYEYGFDYLRDQAAILSRKRPALGERCLQRLRGKEVSEQGSVQKGHPFAIVDEIDSVLIDEATSPLVLAQGESRTADGVSVYFNARRIAGQLRDETDYRVDFASRQLAVTEIGIQKIRAKADSLPRNGMQRPWLTYVEQALRAEMMFKKDEDYIVDNGRIVLVDESTGRIFADRTLRQGLHQAIEAKEGVPITVEHKPLARMSRQRYFRLYKGLCGMTGTATGNERELWVFYRMPVVRIPLRKPCQRKTLPTRCFVDQQSKWRAIAESVARTHEAGQPVLAGTRTIEASRRLAQWLKAMDLPYQLLNGTQDAQEADIIALAGQAGAITVATNMAGRGTDISLGRGVSEKGGLHVIVSEPHESARIDRQLVGRTARQSNPGSCQMFVAADDYLIRLHAPSLGHRMARAANRDGEIESNVSGDIARAQRHAERLNYARRRQVKAQDDWLEDVLSELAREG